MNSSVLLMPCIAERGAWGVIGWVDALRTTQSARGVDAPSDHKLIELQFLSALIRLALIITTPPRVMVRKQKVDTSFTLVLRSRLFLVLVVNRHRGWRFSTTVVSGPMDENNTS